MADDSAKPIRFSLEEFVAFIDKESDDKQVLFNRFTSHFHVGSALDTFADSLAGLVLPPGMTEEQKSGAEFVREFVVISLREAAEKERGEIPVNLLEALNRMEEP